MRKAAFSFCRKKKKSKFEAEATNQVATALEQQAAAQSLRLRRPDDRLGNSMPAKVVGDRTTRQAPSPAVTLSPDPALTLQPTSKETPEIGPGWTLNMVPRRKGERYDYFYFSPTGQRFRNFEEAKTNADSELQASSSNSDQVSPVAAEQDSTLDDCSTCVDGTTVGVVGYKFRKKFLDESGENIGWYDGEVVDILSGTGKSYNCGSSFPRFVTSCIHTHYFVPPLDKDRKCLYAVDGYMEDLSLAELVKLKELAEFEHEPRKKLQLGSVGWTFQKQFPDKKWYGGVVINILKDVGRLCLSEDPLFLFKFHSGHSKCISVFKFSAFTSFTRKWERPSVSLPER